MDSIMKINALKDPNYAPYCLRCSTMMRMTRVEPLLWKCKCGAIHDEREIKKSDVAGSGVGS
jgi:hypothetical protein